jgi:hypothetical protein
LEAAAALVAVTEQWPAGVIPLTVTSSKAAAVLVNEAGKGPEGVVGHPVPLAWQIPDNATPPSREALRLGTTVVDVTENGAVPVATVDARGTEKMALSDFMLRAVV